MYIKEIEVHDFRAFKKKCKLSLNKSVNIIAGINGWGENKMNIGSRIRELRKNKKMTQTDLANLIHVSQQTITKWENNSTEPSGSAIKAIANIFNVSSDYLLGIDEHENSVQEALDSVMSYDGKPMTDNDRNIIEGIIRAYMENKE